MAHERSSWVRRGSWNLNPLQRALRRQSEVALWQIGAISRTTSAALLHVVVVDVVVVVVVVCLCVCVFVCLFVCLFVCFCVCVFVCLFVC